MSAPRIHPLAIVEAGAELGAEVEVGPFCHVHPGARIGERTKLLSHVVVGSYTTLGTDNMVHPGAVIGGAPQDKTYRGEPTTLVVGNQNVIRESVTISRGTTKGGGRTVIGDRNMLMACSHIGHDCRIGNDIIMANAVLIAGHVEVGDRSVLAGAVACHHFARIGRMAYVGGMSRVVHDVPPFTKVAGERVRVRALNLVGLQRAGVPEPEIDELKRPMLSAASCVGSQVLTNGPRRCRQSRRCGQASGPPAPAGRYLGQFRTDRPGPPTSK